MRVHLLVRRLLIDRPHHGRNPRLGAPGQLRQQVGHEVGATPLPASASEHKSTGQRLSALSIGDRRLPGQFPTNSGHPFSINAQSLGHRIIDLLPSGILVHQREG